MRSFRQIHIDFHTAPQIKGVGSQFNKIEFQEELKLAKVDSVTVFAKCHHGMSYYDTEIGLKHPHLEINLTKEMVDAAHEIGIKAPIYLPVGWSENDANAHIEWCVKDKDGKLDKFPTKYKADDSRPYTLWKRLCVNTGYGNLVYDTIKEICKKFDILDGLFLDICFIWDECYCDTCVKKMKDLGIDIDDKNQVKEYYQGVWFNFANTIKSILFKYHHNATCFFNGGTLMRKKQYHLLNSHIEMEDLPTAWGGYDENPLRCKFFSKLGLDYFGMTGKFHRSWGEFGGYKHPEALKYECASMMMYGAGCSVGTQLHPTGKIDKSTIKIIGYAYDYAKKIQEYCFDISETANLGLVLSNDMESDSGIVKMLMENQLDFSIVNSKDNLTEYETIILPSVGEMTDEFIGSINNFVKNGGKLLALGDSSVSKEDNNFKLNLGVDYLGKSTFEHDFVQSNDALFQGIITSPFLMYYSAHKVRVVEGNIEAVVYEPYFNRTFERFCSHGPAPYSPQIASYPAKIRNKNIVYLAHDIGKIYNEYGARLHKEYFINSLREVYENPILDIHLPSTARACLNEQKKRKTLILHISYSSPIQRGNTMVIEDFPELKNIPVKIRTNKKIIAINGINSNNRISYIHKEDSLEFNIPYVRLHEIIEIQYEE